MKHALLIATAVTVLAGTGYVHGRWTNRWGRSPAIADAVARLDRVALNLGDWRGEALTMSPREVRQAEIDGYLLRRYEKRGSGGSISVLLVCGRPGAVAAHVPEVCYGGSGYEREADPVAIVLSGQGAPRPAVFRLEQYRKPGEAVPIHTRILWSLHAAGVWDVPERPRAALAALPCIYKLYVVSDAASADDPADHGPAADFVREQLLPELDRCLSSRN